MKLSDQEKRLIVKVRAEKKRRALARKKRHSDAELALAVGTTALVVGALGVLLGASMTPQSRGALERVLDDRGVQQSARELRRAIKELKR